MIASGTIGWLQLGMVACHDSMRARLVDILLFRPSRICNQDIISRVQQVICFAFHDSKLLLETCREAKHLRKMVTLFYLD